MSYSDIQSLSEAVKRGSAFVHPLRAEIGKAIVGQRAMVDHLLVALIANGHVLMEGLPGLAKTTAIKALADAVDVKFSRIQFTPDMLPADVVGTQIYQPRTGEFTTKKGPVFANFVLADEINRAPAKVQSALLEIMQERQVTLAGETHRLDQPFLVLATQNPIEQEGTYPLPEAQVDRFLLKVEVGYPTPEEELEILKRMGGSADPAAGVRPVVSAADIAAARGLADAIHVEESVMRYAVDLVWTTREPSRRGVDALKGLVAVGASPRASLALLRCARATAFLQGRGYVVPQDVKDVSRPVLRHRVILSYEAEADGVKPDDVVGAILDKVPTP